MLGGDRAALGMSYLPAFEPTAAIRVARDGRLLGYHGIGRFLVVGTLVAPPGAPAGAPGTAFHTYDLLELFRVLAREDSDAVAEVVRYTNLYFYAMNAVLLMVFAGFGIAYWQMVRGEPEIVVSVRADEPRNDLADLAHRLEPNPGHDRPAVIVVASGGGTRAALYTSHVLQGLHGIGADRDIVLASGVSGGGVALAYFAANYRTLADPGATADQWKRFRDRVGGNLIGDVLEGASEWRIFGAAPLTMLLAESFERRLMRDGGATTMQLGTAPALILNTAITGHPAEDSEVLMRMLNRVPGSTREDCLERARPYSMMNGGRLVFTNLKNRAAFPAIEAPIPNTRLPYWLVDDLDVPLARAAALNANFPPIFPNARVEVRPGRGDGPCPERSYFVTDGGAQENLGLISALYAVQSALMDLSAKCSGKRCRLRPLHFVIAEASVADYDYKQDRGLSALMGGSRERLTGGLTNALISQTKELYERLASNAQEPSFHYLPLPLTFRSRGGFGTHWMHASRFELTDPRLRIVPEQVEGRPFSTLSKATISKEEIDQVWLALHDTRKPYCQNRDYGSIATDRVRRWICGAPGDSDGPRDLHIGNWQTAIKVLSK